VIHIGHTHAVATDCQGTICSSISFKNGVVARARGCGRIGVIINKWLNLKSIKVSCPPFLWVEYKTESKGLKKQIKLREPLGSRKGETFTGIFVAVLVQRILRCVSYVWCLLNCSDVYSSLWSYPRRVYWLLIFFRAHFLGGEILLSHPVPINTQKNNLHYRNFLLHLITHGDYKGQ
jgi:hypothetical protein